MRSRHLTAVVLTMPVLLLAACSSGSEPLAVPSMPSASPTATSATQGGAGTAPAGQPAATPSSSAVSGPSALPKEWTVDPVTGETSDPSTFGGPVQDAAPADTVPDMATDPVYQQYTEVAGVQDNAQATRKVGSYTPEQTQQAFNTLLSFLMVGTRHGTVIAPQPGTFTNDAALRSAVDAAVLPFTTSGARADLVAKSSAVYRTPVAQRTADQQAFMALVPVGVCESIGNCFDGTGTQFSDPTITPWTAADGSQGLKFVNRQFYIVRAKVTTTEGAEVVQRVRVSYQLTAGLVPSADGWLIDAITASDLAVEPLS